MSQSTVKSNKYVMKLTLFIAGKEINVEIPVSEEKYAAIKEERNNGEYHWSADSVIDDYLNGNFESDYTIEKVC